MKKQDMNLLERYHLDQKTQAQKASPLRIYIIVLVSSLLIAGAYIFQLIVENNSLRTEKLRLETYLSNESILNQLTQVKEVQAKIDLLDTIEEEAYSLVDVMEYMPKISSYTLDIVDEQKPSGVTIVSIEYSDNVLLINCTASNAADFSNYVNRLRNMNHFVEVANDGYDYDENIYRYTGSIAAVLEGGQ